MMKSLYQNRTDKTFYDKWESLPEEKRHAEIRRRLFDYLSHALSVTPFYKERLRTLSESHAFPLLNVPVLKSDDLREVLPPKSELLIQKPNSGYTVFQSGGTTGVPKTTLFSSEELDGLDLPNARGFFATGLTDQDKVANLWASGALYMTFVHMNRCLQQYGCTSFPFANHSPAEFVYQVSKAFGINCFTGVGSVMLNSLREMENLGGIQIEKIYYGGEHYYETDKKELQEKFGTKIILAPGYGTVDTWYIGYQCLNTPTGVFHAHDDQCYIEIVNEETGKHVEKEEVGMLYATAFPRRLTPIVRYRVGDRAKWLKELCTCGRTTPLFKLLGRGDDVLRIGYDSIDYNAIQDCVLKVDGLLGSIQMEKQRELGKDRLVIRVESDLPVEKQIPAAKQLEEIFLSSRPSIKDIIATGRVWPVKIEVVAANSLKRNQRTGKLIRVIDYSGEGA